MSKLISGLVLAASAAVTLQQNHSIPTAIVHGFGDACIYPGMWEFTDMVSEKTGAYASCIEIGLIGTATSIFENFESQAEQACASVLANENFQGEFNVIGLSQGGLIARHIVERCATKVPVRNLVTIGGPNMGVSASPNCASGFYCDIINWVIDHAVYFSYIQDFIGPAGYFRDPKDLEYYLNYSVFLPYLNNEKNYTQSIYDRFTALHGALFVLFSNDTMIFPKETAWFHELQADGTILATNETQFYKEDFIGLRNLTEAGKVQYVEWNGNHLQFTDEEFNAAVIPLLLS
jgi:palmitoyl-protein thioesterase